MRFPVNRFFYFSALALVAPGASAASRPPVAPLAPTGPAADYPVVVGDPFTIDDTVWTPTDQLNYDAVGYVTVGGAGLEGVSAAHKTLPLPSYAEVTSLDTGKTILVRVTRRGPMTNSELLELSPMAAAQLGVAAGGRVPIRVRRVNPPEQERAMLRGGGNAPERMETPDGLLRVLRRKLAEQSPLAAPPSSSPVSAAVTAPDPATKTAIGKAAKNSAKSAKAPLSPAAVQPPTASAQPPKPSTPGTAAATTKPIPPQPSEQPSATPKAGNVAGKDVVVQVAAFSIEANARKVAKNLGASVSKTGKYWRVRMGPYTNRAQAAQALEKAKRSGYSDARIQSAD